MLLLQWGKGKGPLFNRWLQMFKSVQFRIYNQPAHVGPMGHETRKVQTGEERDTWHMDPTTALGPLGSSGGVSNRRTQGHLTYGLDPTTGSLGGQCSGECLIDEHLWHYRDPGLALDVHHLWRVGPLGKNQDIVLLCHTMSCHVLSNGQTHTCEVDEEGAPRESAKKSTCI